MDMTGLRELLKPLIVGLHVNGHKRLPGICAQLGLPPVPDQGSRSEKMTAVYAAVPDTDLPRLAERFIEVHNPPAESRNPLQDWLWARQPHPEIPKRARHDIARSVRSQNLFLSDKGFDSLLDRLWVLDDINFGAFLGRLTLRDDIQHNIHLNRGGWSTEVLFEKLGAFEAAHRRFALFLEGLASAEVLPNEAAQRRFVGAVNGCLRPHGVELRETGSDGAYPVFTVESTRSASNRRPKNLIFASSVKPDLRFRNAVDNDVEIVTNADKVLVYDRPIGGDGLRWKDLQAWWADVQAITDEQRAKVTLYQRLSECLPENSPPQRFLFSSYYRSFGKAVPELPALLPEVWLHWDPQTVRERGRDALFRFRMDFLMLLPHGIRVVLEVDGKQHYSDRNGVADTKLYAQTVAADRDLKLSGYEVFRFGGSELQGVPNHEEMVKTFFQSLFRLNRVAVPGG